MLKLAHEIHVQTILHLLRVDIHISMDTESESCDSDVLFKCAQGTDRAYRP